MPIYAFFQKEVPPELLSNLALSGCTVTIDAMGTQTAIAEAIQVSGLSDCRYDSSSTTSA
jgi:predicted transposase YbfD/YdcC